MIIYLHGITSLFSKIIFTGSSFDFGGSGRVAFESERVY